MSIVPWRERKLRDRWLAGATTAILIGMLAPGIMFWSAHRAHAAPVQPAPSQSAMRFPLIAWVDDLTAGVRVYCPITQLGPNWWLAMVPPSFIPDRTHRLIWHVDYMPPGSNFSFMGSQGIVPAPTFGGITS